MNPRFLKGVIIVGLVGAAVGLAAYFARQYKLLENSCYAIAGGVVHSFGISNVSMTLFFKIVNESDITIEISDILFNLSINGMFVTKILKPDSQTIYSGSSAIVQVDFQFNPQTLLKAGLANISSILLDKSKLIIGLTGTFSVKTGGVTLKNFPFDEEISLQDIMTPSPDADRCAAKLKGA